MVTASVTADDLINLNKTVRQLEAEIVATCETFNNNRVAVLGFVRWLEHHGYVSPEANSRVLAAYDTIGTEINTGLHLVVADVPSPTEGGG